MTLAGIRLAKAQRKIPNIVENNGDRLGLEVMTDSSTPKVEDVHGSGIYPATGPFPKGAAAVRSPAAFAHPEERERTAPGRQGLETAALTAGRLIFGGYFLYNGINHFLNRKMLVDYARSKGVPSPDIAVAASGLMILTGGLSVLTGVQPKVGAGLISAFLLVCRRRCMHSGKKGMRSNACTRW
jgi:hypothetical protein